VSDIRQLAKALPHIVRFEFLAEVPARVGTRFRETRLMNGKEYTTELEVTEFLENDRIRIVADSHGTIWDTLFTVQPANGQTLFSMTMEGKAYKWTAKIINCLIRGMVQKGVERDMDLVKAYCEG
jgi:flavorubredoxin